MYRFFVYNSHCRHVFLACCHDNGYVAELDKFRHDPVAAPKTTLVHAAHNAREYASLSFPIARFGSVFETTPLMGRIAPVIPKIKQQLQLFDDPVSDATSTSTTMLDPAPSRSSYSSVSALPESTVAQLSKKAATSSPTSLPPDEEKEENCKLPQPSSQLSKSVTGDPRGIPINRAGQRIDRRLRSPTTQEQEQFDARVGYRKLCNEHHLRNACYQYRCKYDHDPIDDNMKNTLKNMARRIPCQTGMKCRRPDCYFGHQCPWGSDTCTNPKCAFLKAGLHDIYDLEIAKFVPSAPV